MPFTPFHLGPALLFGLALSMAFDLPTLLMASVIPDVEPFMVLYFNIHGYPLHGFFHSYLGSTFLAVTLAVFVYLFRGPISKIVRIFRMSQKPVFKKIIFTSFASAYTHVLLDSFLYGEMEPFYPLPGNFFVNLISASETYSVIYGFCGITALLGIVTYVNKIRKGVAVLD